MIRILRIIEYTYSDNETAEQDMAAWKHPSFGTKKYGSSKTVKSTIIVDLDFEDENVHE